MKLVFPADMASHWAMFGCGGEARTASAQPCHRCQCPYGELGAVFDYYEVQPGDTLTKIAAAHGIDVPELLLINPGTANASKLLHKHHTSAQSKEEMRSTVEVSQLTADQCIIGEEQSDEAKWMRVHKQWDMDRECPEAFLKVAHIQCPPCMEHATQRVTEYLLKPICEKAKAEGKVSALNNAWEKHRYVFPACLALTNRPALPIAAVLTLTHLPGGISSP
jgi:hypothetical protein